MGSIIGQWNELFLWHSVLPHTEQKTHEIKESNIHFFFDHLETKSKNSESLYH